MEIDPILSGLDYGYGLRGIKYLLLLAKYKDSDFFKLIDFPIDVVVFIPENLGDPLNSLKP